jgi:hypothetical protein
MKAPVKSSLFHLAIVPPMALALDLLLWKPLGHPVGVLAIFAVGLPLFYIILALPALVHGLIFWKSKIENKKKGILPFSFCIITSTLGYFTWFMLWGGRIKKDIDQAVIVMALVSALTYIIFSKRLRQKADQGAGINSVTSLRDSTP